MDFAELLEQAEFALKGAFGSGFVAQHEVVFLDLIGRPASGGVGNGDHEIVVLELDADAEPLRLGGFDDEIVRKGIGVGPIDGLPTREEAEPIVFGFAGEDESGRAGTVFAGVLGRSSAACGRGGSGAAGIAFLVCGIEFRIGIGDTIRIGDVDGWLVGRWYSCGCGEVGEIFDVGVFVRGSHLC